MHHSWGEAVRQYRHSERIARDAVLANLERIAVATDPRQLVELQRRQEIRERDLMWAINHRAVAQSLARAVWKANRDPWS